ncbi:MAG: ATP phosphoribosyltransferase regulatory subunit, partial [Noviherbaspirillum sp.]
LVLSSLALAGISHVRLDLCHVGVMRAIIANNPKARNHEAELFVLLEAKDVFGLKALTRDFDTVTREALLALPGLYGDASTIARARAVLAKVPGIAPALDELELLIKQVDAASVTVDLADLRGYHYHSGVMFAAYVSGLPNAVARGGRYDHVGEAFGRARPATGFSMDLRELARLMPGAERKRAVRAPWGTEPALRQKIAALRKTGEVVIQTLPGHENDQDEFDCDRAVVYENGSWILKKLG